MSSRYWSPGTQILWRYGDGFVDPMTVVRDDADALVAWLPAGTPVLRRVREDGRELRAVAEDMFTAPRRTVRGAWETYDVLRIHPVNAWWSVWVFFRAGVPVTDPGRFEGWYVNLEDPHTRDLAARTTTSRDHVLDVEVDPDRTRRRKDEDELVLAVEQGRYNADEADLIRGVAAQAEAVVDAWGSPFCDGWETFVPDPAWPLPGPPPLG